MKILISEKLSEHKYKTPEGYLVCVDSILARTGKQTYRRNELFHDGDDTEVEVDRTPEEVFSEATLASFENKPVTVEHPDEDVNINNYKEYAVGFVRDVKRGEVDGQDVILGTLVITDAQTIEEIENGEHTELSCGYDCDILDEDNPTQRNIRGNHVALCEQGRAGIAKIVDSVNDSDYLVELGRDDNLWQVVVTASSIKEAGIKAHKLYKDPVRNVFKLADSVDDSLINDKNRLPAKDRKFISNYLRMISTYTSRDVDIRDLLRPLSGHGYNWTIEKIDGWKWNKGEYAHKDYYVSINGYDDRFLVTLYADPNQDWKVKEVNAYFTDSINDSINDAKPTHITKLVKQGQFYSIYEYEENGKKYLLVGEKGLPVGKTVNCGGCVEFRLSEAEKTLNEWELMKRLEKKYGEKEGQRRYLRGEKDSVSDSTYKCEFNLNEDTMWTYVKADSPEDAKREILDKFANAKNISVTGHDSVEDSLFIKDSNISDLIEKMWFSFKTEYEGRASSQSGYFDYSSMTSSGPIGQSGTDKIDFEFTKPVSFINEADSNSLNKIKKEASTKIKQTINSYKNSIGTTYKCKNITFSVRNDALYMTVEVEWTAHRNKDSKAKLDSVMKVVSIIKAKDISLSAFGFKEGDIVTCDRLDMTRKTRYKIIGFDGINVKLQQIDTNYPVAPKSVRLDYAEIRKVK